MHNHQKQLVFNHGKRSPAKNFPYPKINAIQEFFSLGKNSFLICFFSCTCPGNSTPLCKNIGVAKSKPIFKEFIRTLS